MLKKVILIGACIGVSASVPLLYQANPDMVRLLLSSDTGEATAQSLVASAAQQTALPTPNGRSVAIAVDETGHFFGAFKLNGRKVDALIDTGASAVAINLSTARRLGLNIRLSDMTNSVNTANGKARATVAVIDRIEIGRIEIRDVQAMVLEDASLSTALVGMTFLNRLRAFKVEEGRLLLTQ